MALFVAMTEVLLQRYDMLIYNEGYSDLVNLVHQKHMTRMVVGV